MKYHLFGAGRYSSTNGFNRLKSKFGLGAECFWFAVNTMLVFKQSTPTHPTHESHQIRELSRKIEWTEKCPITFETSYYQSFA